MGSAKRQAAGAPVTQAKKARTEKPVAPPQGPAKARKAAPLAKVAAALHESDMGKGVVDLVEAMLQDALITYKDERHEFQEQVVGMAATLLESAEQVKIRTVEAATVAKDACEEGKASCQAAVTFAKDALVQATNESAELLRSLADRAKVFQEAKKAMLAAQVKQTQQQEEAQSARQCREQLIQGEQDYLLPLLESVEDEARAKELQESLLSILKNYSFEASVIAALPNALLKPPASRGAFDAMVLEQLRKDLGEHARRLEEIAVAASAAAAVAGGEAEKASVQLASADLEQQAAAEAFEAAQQRESACQVALEDVQQTVKSCAPEVRRRGKELAEAQRELAAFRSGPLETFRALRERCAPTAEPAVQEVPCEAELTHAEQVSEAVAQDVTEKWVEPAEEDVAPDESSKRLDSQEEATCRLSVAIVAGA